MSEDDDSLWNVDSLRIYIEHEISSIRANIELRHETETAALVSAFAAQERAIEKADAANEKRFDSVNEFRAQLNDQASRFMPRQESISKHEATGEKLDAQIKLVSESLIELRNQMNDLAVRFMPRAEAEAHYSLTLDRLRELEMRMQAHPNREETALALTAADAKGATIMTSIAASHDALKETVMALDRRVSSRLDVSTGRSSGYASLYGWAVAGIGLLISVIIVANTVLGSSR